MEFKRITDLVPVDKLFHFMAGMIIGFIVGFWWNPVATICAVLGVAILKELYDFFSKTGTVEALDIAATVAGGGVAIGIYQIHKLFPHIIA